MQKDQFLADRLARLNDDLHRGQVSRRDFLRLMALAGVSVAGLGACGSAPTATPLPPTAKPIPTDTPVPKLSGQVVFTGLEMPLREEFWKTFTPDIKIVPIIEADQPAAIQKLRVGSILTDIFEINSAFLYYMHEYDLIQSIDQAKLTNWSKVLPGFQRFCVNKDTGKLDMIPIDWGTDAIAYNADEVSAEEASTWEVLWNPKFKGRTSLRNDATEGLAVVGVQLGVKDPWNQTTEELAASLAFLKEHKGNLRTLWTNPGDLETLFLNGEVVASHSWWALVKPLKDAGLNIAWAEPRQGSLGWLEGMSLTKNAPEPDLAHVALDHMMSDDFVKAYYDAFGYRMATDVLLSYLPEEKIKELGLNNVDEVLKNCWMWGATLNLEEYQQTWTEFLSA